MRERKIGKTCIQVRRQTGNDELMTNVIYRKLLTKIQEDDPYLAKAKSDAAWNYAEVCGSIVMSGTVAGWKAPLYTDSPAEIQATMDTWMSMDARLRNLIVRDVADENAPLNDPSLVPPELLRPEEREDPLSEPQDGGS